MSCVRIRMFYRAEFMQEEVRLLAKIRHIKRREDGIILPMLLLSGSLLCMSISAETRSKNTLSLIYAGGSVATLVGGKAYLTKLGKEKQDLYRRIAQLHRERG